LKRLVLAPRQSPPAGASVRLHNVQNQSIGLLGVMPTVSDTRLMTPPRAEQGKGLGWTSGTCFYYWVASRAGSQSQSKAGARSAKTAE